MMQYPNKITDFNAFLNAESYAGRALEASLPELQLQIANHRGAGMDGPAPVDTGIEAMKASLTLADWPPELIKVFGTRQRLTLRPATTSMVDHSSQGYVATIGGLWTVVNFADLKPGADVPLKLTLEADYFRLLHEGEELFEIDIKGGKRVVGGVDQLAEKRKAMGLL